MSNSLVDLFNQGAALFRSRRYAEALAAYDQALALSPGHPRLLLNRGQTLRALGRLEEAAADLQASADNEPGAVDPLRRLIEVLTRLHRPAAMVAAAQRAVAISPDDAGLHRTLGIALRMDRRIPEAVAAFERADALDPRLRCRAQAGACQLMLGDFEAGWRNFESRGYTDGYVNRFAAAPRWTGGRDFTGRTVLVHAEQGFGDTIMLCRYIPLLARDGATVLFAPQPRLRRLLASLPARMVDLSDPGLVFDTSIRTFSLPLAYETRRDTIPAETPYLAAEPALVDLWRGVVGATGLRIGVAWRGSDDADHSGRSFDPRQLAPLAALPGVRLISLQKDDPEWPPARLAAVGIETLPRELDAGGDAFVDTAAVMMACDLVVTLDSAVAHLAGALGRPVWIALSRHSEWRWLIDRTDSPWHPTARLWRQTDMDDWSPAFAGMAAALTAGQMP